MKNNVNGRHSRPCFCRGKLQRESRGGFLTEKGGRIFLKVKVIPRSSCNEIKEISEGVLKVRLTSPPVEGKANKQLITFLSENFKIKKSEIKIVSGLKSREKLIEISAKEISAVIGGGKEVKLFDNKSR